MNIHRNVKKLIPTLLFSALLSLLGIVAAIYVFGVDMPLGPKIFGLAICIVPTIPILFLFRNTIKRIQHSEPEIIIDDEGIYIWQWADKKIAWDNIDEIRQYGSAGARILSLKLSDPELDPPRKRKAKFFDLNRNMLEKAQSKLQDPNVKIAAIALSPVAVLSMRVASGAPDHRDPIFHANGTDVTPEQLITAVNEHRDRSLGDLRSNIT
jgi:hypothetical protein